MEELRIDYPDVHRIVDWEQEAFEEFKDEPGEESPDYSAEGFVLTGNRPIRAANFDRIEDMISEAEMLMVFRDIDDESWDRQLCDEDFIRKQDRISEEFKKGFMDFTAYMDRLHKAAPDQINDQYFSEQISFESLQINMSVAEELQSVIQSSDDFALTETALSGIGRCDDPVAALYDIENDLSITVGFKYAGNQKALENYNELTSDFGDHRDYSGVPGYFVTGHGKNYVDLAYNSEIGLSHSEIEDRIRDETSGILGARENVLKKQR